MVGTEGWTSQSIAPRTFMGMFSAFLLQGRITAHDALPIDGHRIERLLCTGLPQQNARNARAERQLQGAVNRILPIDNRGFQRLRSGWRPAELLDDIRIVERREMGGAVAPVQGLPPPFAARDHLQESKRPFLVLGIFGYTQAPAAQQRAALVGRVRSRSDGP